MRRLIESLEAFHKALEEAKADLGARAVVLMGLPAAGKSTFVKNELTRWVPGFKAPNVENTDVQVKKTQYDHAFKLFDVLKAAESKEEYDDLVAERAYESFSGEEKKIVTTYEEFQKMRGGDDFFNANFKSFFGSWFDMRDVAKRRTDDLFADKVTKSGDGLVIDTVASDPDKILKKLAKTKAAGMSNTVIYLDTEARLAIIRDIWRGKEMGRSVGEGVIMSYVPKMDKAFAAYKKDLESPDGVIDRLFHFTWQQQGDDPIKGKWIKKAEYRGDQKRQQAARRAGDDD